MVDNTTWIDKLFDSMDEMFSDGKKIKFNTHKNRKAFVNSLKATIKQAVEENTNPKAAGRMPPTITRPNPNKEPTGFAVMTGDMSNKADDLGPVNPGSAYNKEAIKKNNSTVRSW
jgi:hypothetical protein